jgi:type IV fimbrial biogenesis protein FimT
VQLMAITSPARRVRKDAQGFTLVELMVTVVLMAILFMLAIPSFTGMVRNSQVRTVAESLQSGLRLAQAEAVRRNRQTVFSLTNAEPSSSSAAVANGRNWAIHTVLRVSENAANPEDAANRVFIQGGALSDSAAGVTISNAPIAVCFSSAGRLVDNAAPGVSGATCSVTATPPRYDFALTGADRPLRVTLSVGGQIRMCDPNKVLSSTHPDGC